jgi:hypothetical protein
MKRKMLVLGAGASIGSKRYPILSSLDQMRDTMPSADNFFYDLFRTNRTENRPAGHLNFLGLTFEGLNDLIIRLWNINEDGYNPDEWRGVNIEEVMTFFDIGSKMFEPTTNEGKMYRTAQKSLLSFMHPFIPMICEDQHCEYLLDVLYQLNKNDCIISFNWDTIIDFSLQRANMPQLKNYAKLLRADHINPSNFRNVGLLLKLHGSFNWMICNNPKCSTYNKIKPPFQNNRYKLQPLRKTYTCPDCGNGNMKVLIVPPVSDKMIYKNSFLKNQWLIAREKLLDISEIIFIGYSFPPTDYYSDWLFRQIYFIEKRPELIITIVNPEYGKKGSIVTKRYNNLFKGFTIKSYKTLKDYAKNN